MSDEPSGSSLEQAVHLVDGLHGNCEYGMWWRELYLAIAHALDAARAEGKAEGEAKAAGVIREIGCMDISEDGTACFDMPGLFIEPVSSIVCPSCRFLYELDPTCLSARGDA